MRNLRTADPAFDPRWVAWLAFAAIVVHAALYLSRVANPLVISDAWYYVDGFLRKAAEGQLTFGDFFAKRTAVDHSLPFHKLLMLLNYRLFGLDLSVDSWIGFAFAIAGTLLFRHAIRRSTGEAFATWPVQLAWLSAAAIYLSLNASHIYEWPLLTLSFVTMFFGYCLFVACHRAVADGRWAAMLPAAFLVLVTLDNGGVIVVLAALLATAWLAMRLRVARRGLAMVGLLALAIVVYKVGYLVLAPQPPDAATSMPALRALLAKPGALWPLAASLTMPLSAAVLHPLPASGIFGSAAKGIEFLIAVSMVAAHAWFWWQAWKGRPTPAWHLAIALMLVFYGLCAGVLIGRAPQFGGAVFGQPRYVVFYQLHVVALMLMAATWYGSRDAVQATRERVLARVQAGAMVAACATLLALQIPVDRAAWTRAPYARRYVEQLALQMAEMGSAPAALPDKCLPPLVVCRMPPEVRVRAVVFLRDHHLNLFSDAFRRRHGFAAATE